MGFICFDNLYKWIKTPGGAILMPDDNNIVYIKPEDVRYVKGAKNLSNNICSEVMLYNGKKFYIGMSAEDVMKKLGLL